MAATLISTVTIDLSAMPDRYNQHNQPIVLYLSD